MPGTSAYVQISKYALLEYQYNSENIPISGSAGSAGALRLENKYLGTYQFLNTNPSVSLTGNVLDRSAGRTGELSNRWAYFDIDTAVPIFQTNSNYDVVNQTANLISIAGKYDTARLHILSGFDFPGLDGIILQIRWKEWVLNESSKSRFFDACNQVYLKGQPQIQFNANPLFLGDRLYDRYIDVKIPSLFEVNQDFWNSTTANNTIGYNYTFDNVGFLQNSQIFANLFEIDSSEISNGNLFLITGNSYTTAFNAADNYSQLGVVIAENPTYDYIEYYPTWNGAFIETYLSDLNSVGGNWVVINQIEVYEQVGNSSLRTANMTMLQENNYDQPGIFRPVIQNASIAYSYTIDYTMRFFNRVDNTEIVRKSAFTSTDVKKYGKQLDKINVLQGFTPVKVYNKIVQMSQDNSTDFGITALKEVVTQKIITPVFYDTNMITVDSAYNTNQSLGQTVWPQGTNTIYLGAFDNMIKFKIFTLSPDKKDNVSFDLSTFSKNIALAFNTADNNKVYVDMYTDINLADPSMGEIVFRIDTSTAVTVLGSPDKTYYIINNTDPETVLYSGKYDNLSNVEAGTASSANSILSVLDNQIASSQAQLAAIQASIQSANTTLSGGSTTMAGKVNQSTANAVLLNSQAQNTEQTQADQTVLTQAQAAQQNAIQQASQGGTVPNIVEIPGVTTNMGANPQVSIRPLVEYPASPATGFNIASNPATQGNTTIAND